MNKIALRQSAVAGIIVGVIYTALSFGTYYSGINSFAKFSMVSPWVPFVLILILILGFNLRKKLGGFISFKEVLQYAFVAYLIYQIIVAIFTYVLFIIIDPTLTKKLFDAVIQITINFMKSVGAPQAKIDEAMANASKQEVSTAGKNIIQGIAFNLIWDFVKSLLIAWIVKKTGQPTWISILNPLFNGPQHRYPFIE